MRLRIMPLLMVPSSQSATHPHRHQREVRRPHQHEGVHRPVVVPPRFVLFLRTPPPPSLKPLPGWELATTAEGTPYHLAHNRGITTWERPELPKHRVPVAKQPVKRSPLDKPAIASSSSCTTAQTHPKT